YTIPAGQMVRLGFAVLGGKTLAALKTSSDNAKIQWNQIKALLDVAGSPGGRPASYSLGQNYPNPFNPTTRIEYALPRTARVTLKVYDVLGREVAVLVNAEQSPGMYTVPFDAAGLSSGMYFYRMTADESGSPGSRTGSFSDVKKLVVVK